MTISEQATRFDGWIIDRIFQPVADRLSDFFSVVQLGLSFQLGSLMLTGVSLILPLFVFGATLSATIEAVLVWFLNFAFFLGMKRSVPLIRQGMLNPLRPMMLGVRLISLFFLVYQIYVAANGLGVEWVANQLMTLSQITFVMGLYFVACQVRPPHQRLSKKKGIIIEGTWQGSGRIN